MDSVSQEEEEEDEGFSTTFDGQQIRMDPAVFSRISFRCLNEFNAKLRRLWLRC